MAPQAYIETMDTSRFKSSDDALDHALATLGRAAQDKTSPMRWPVLCTDGPSGRIVVLRHFERETRICRLYSDQRTTKMKGIASHPKAELVFFDPADMLQIRLSGRARIVTSGPDWDAALQALPDAARQDYAALLPPGAQLASNDAEFDPSVIAGNFAMIEVSGDTIDWLCLSRNGHRRARGYWPEHGEPRTDWIVP
ncbi:MAG: pyridoxamine 5'-phosphate oxidase family protein [Pseudomonadota bacterium]